MVTKSYKEETFKSWSELLLLLEYSTLFTDDLEEIYVLHKTKYSSQKGLQDFKSEILFKDLEVLIDGNIYREINYKWQESIVNAYKFLQYAKSRGGTYGHKVGCLLFFLKTNLEVNQLKLLKLEKLDSKEYKTKTRSKSRVRHFMKLYCERCLNVIFRLLNLEQSRTFQ